MDLKNAFIDCVAQPVVERPWILEHLPRRFLLWLARLVAEPRSIGWYPGWYFGTGQAIENPRVRLRERLWRHFASLKLQESFVMSWDEGLKVWIYLGNDLSWAMFVVGCFEPNEFALLAEVLRPGMTFVDVGANDGLYSLFAAKRVGRSGKVVAVEPSTREFDRLSRNLMLNRLWNVQTFHVAASDCRGEGTLRVAGYSHEGHNTLGTFIYDTDLARTEKVRLVPLDDLIDDIGVSRVDVIKMDIEGAEYSALQGARKVLHHHRPMLLLELSDPALRKQGSSRQDILRILDELGYCMYALDPTSGRPVPARIPPEQDPNIVAVPLEKQAVLASLVVEGLGTRAEWEQ